MNAYKTLVEIPEGKRPLGRPRCKWDDNIKMDLKENSLKTSTVFFWLGIRFSGWRNEPPDLIKGGEFFD
jgi:hypothetical protein